MCRSAQPLLYFCGIRRSFISSYKSTGSGGTDHLSHSKQPEPTEPLPSSVTRDRSGDVTLTPYFP